MQVIPRASCRIVVPVYRTTLTPEEEISLTSIRRQLLGSGISFAAPESLDLSGIQRDGESAERFPDEFFCGIDGYNRLLKSSLFYSRFQSYEYILIAQLDCLIFSSNLNEWMDKGWDYLAAPWFKGFSEDHAAGLWRVGNGGLSLRRVASYLRVLSQQVVSGSIYPRWGHCAWKPPLESWELGLYQKVSRIQGINPFAKVHAVEDELSRFPYNEDVFWAIEAPKFYPSFQVAPAEAALSFAFEVSPRWSLEKTKGKLPFGCHAWTRYDRHFWEEVLSDHENFI
jgi:hypothetical protein